MYEYTPKRENLKAAHLILLMLVGGFLLLGLTAALPALPFRWIFQLVGIACLAVGIFLYTRYFTKAFTYSVMPRDDGSLDFCVTECGRKSRITVCRLSLASVERVEVLSADDRARAKTLKKELRAEGRKLYFYTVNLAPSSLCYLVATECSQPLVVVLEPDETLLKMLGKGSL